MMYSRWKLSKFIEATKHRWQWINDDQYQYIYIYTNILFSGPDTLRKLTVRPYKRHDFPCTSGPYSQGYRKAGGDYQGDPRVFGWPVALSAVMFVQYEPLVIKNKLTMENASFMDILPIFYHIFPYFTYKK